MDYLETVITLPPGFLPPETLREALRLSLETFRWFEPKRFGMLLPEEKIPAGDCIATLLRRYEKEERVAGGGRGDRHVVQVRPDRRGAPVTASPKL